MMPHRRMRRRRGPGRLLLLAILTAGLAATAADSGGSAVSSPPAVAPAPASDATAADSTYRQEIDAWHQRRIERLRRKEGWLTLVGLFRLHEGDNPFGSAAGNDLRFPAGAPAHAGSIRVQDHRITVTAEPGVDLRHDGQTVHELALQTDRDGGPTVLELGSLRFYVIDRAGDLLVRLRDLESPALAAFTGIDRFPVSPHWRVAARLEPYDPPRTISVPNVLGTSFDEPCPGALVFEIDGQSYRLDPTEESDGSLFLVFGDLTNGDETYGGGRFLVAQPPEEGSTVVLDFNRAYNPPCAFTPYATCPLPPAENKLPIAVRAGEKAYEGGTD